MKQGHPTSHPCFAAGRDHRRLHEDLLSTRLLLSAISKVTVTLSESSYRLSPQPQMSEQEAGTRWEPAPHACEEAAGLISLLTLLCQLITGLSGTLMHAPLTAIQLSSLLRMPYQYTCSYVFPQISQRCKELPTGDGFCSCLLRRQTVQPKSQCQ